MSGARANEGQGGGLGEKAFSRGGGGVAGTWVCWLVGPQRCFHYGGCRRHVVIYIYIYCVSFYLSPCARVLSLRPVWEVICEAFMTQRFSP